MKILQIECPALKAHSRIMWHSTQFVYPCFNPLKCSGVRYLHLKVFNAIPYIFNF